MRGENSTLILKYISPKVEVCFRFAYWGGKKDTGSVHVCVCLM